MHEQARLYDGEYANLTDAPIAEFDGMEEVSPLDAIDSQMFTLTTTQTYCNEVRLRPETTPRVVNKRKQVGFSHSSSIF